MEIGIKKKEGIFMSRIILENSEKNTFLKISYLNL